MNFKRYISLFGLVVVSSYLVLLLLQEGLVFFSHEKVAVDEHVEKYQILDLCPQNEHMQFQAFEGMGDGLVRRPDVGWILNPKTTGNPKGYLGDCFPYKKDSTVKRVIFLGDSFTGAVQVPYEKTFVKIVESKLQKKYPGWKIEVINLGIGGYGTDQEYFTLIGEAKKYSPDIIIHGIFLGNDIRDNSYNLYKYSEWPAHWPHPVKRYVTIKNSKELEIHDADLDYYYEMNLSAFFGKNKWMFDIAGEKYSATFNYDADRQRLFGMLLGAGNDKPDDTIDKVRFFEKNPVSLHLEKRDKWLHVTAIEGGSISGTVGDDINMHFVGTMLPLENKEKVATLAKRVRSSFSKHILLLDLREFVKSRLLRSYTFSRFLLKNKQISAEDMPIFQQLLEYQGNYPTDYQLFFKKYDDPEWEKAWDITFMLVDRMRTFSVQTLNAPYVAFTIPSMETVYPDYWESAQDYYPELRRVAANMDVVKPVVMADDFFKERNIPQISLYPQMVEDYKHTKVKLYDNKHAHFNEAGHQFVGSFLADFIINNKYIEQ